MVQPGRQAPHNPIPVSGIDYKPTSPIRLTGRLSLLGAALLAAACGHGEAAAGKVPATARTSSLEPQTAGAALHSPRPPFVAPSSYAAFTRAEILAARGEYRAATEYYDLALASAEPDTYLLCRYAEALGRSHQHQDAEAMLQQAEQLDPTSALPALVRGDLARLQGQTERAILAYTHALQLQPGASAAAIRLLHLLDAAGAEERVAQLLPSLTQQGSELSTLSSRDHLQTAVANHNHAAAQDALDRLQAQGALEPSFLAPLVRDLLDQCAFGLASLLSSTLPTNEAIAPLQLRAWIGSGRNDAARDLLLRHPDSWFGGPLPTAWALLQVDEPALALSLAEAALLLARDEPPAQQTPARLLIAAAHLQLLAPRDALDALQPVDFVGAQRVQAQALVAIALRSAGLPRLAQEFYSPVANAGVGGQVDGLSTSLGAILPSMGGNPERRSDCHGAWPFRTP